MDLYLRFGNSNPPGVLLAHSSNNPCSVRCGFMRGMASFATAFVTSLAIGGHNTQFMLPHRGIELTFWIALSVTAGICEETIFRGYLQRQFMALTKSAPAGILLSAATFGAAHTYQGFRMVILIGLYGAMFGILAYWRGSVRPGMIAHAWQDSLNGVLASAIRP